MSLRDGQCDFLCGLVTDFVQIKNSKLKLRLLGVAMEIVNVTPKDICRILWHVVASICVIMLAWKLINLI
ncbi:hypothetical protein AKO42_08530 [Salmonella enterica subsp. enterica serovar Nottingham]|nr:hypothetical protein AKO42_08530 [Salmonella enterica subsp. enterica serovar Nottingham]